MPLSSKGVRARGQAPGLHLTCTRVCKLSNQARALSRRPCARSSAWTRSRARRCTPRSARRWRGWRPSARTAAEQRLSQRNAQLVDNSVIMSLVNMSMNRRAPCIVLAVSPPVQQGRGPGFCGLRLRGFGTPRVRVAPAQRAAGRQQRHHVPRQHVHEQARALHRGGCESPRSSKGGPRFLRPTS